MNPFHKSGFTLYELLMTLLIVGVVLAAGIPNLLDFNANGRITSAVNELHSSFQIGRSEAARSKSNVTICASANSQDPGANCNGKFDDGWIVFLDQDGNIERAETGENILRRHAAIDSSLDINVANNSTYFSFAPTGLGRGNVGGAEAFSTAIICDPRGNTTAAGGNSAARYLIVTPIGRATVIRDVSIIAAAGGCP